MTGYRLVTARCRCVTFCDSASGFLASFQPDLDVVHAWHPIGNAVDHLVRAALITGRAFVHWVLSAAAPAYEVDNEAE